jgi:hypothetical protein
MMNFVASVMDNETVVIVLGLAGMFMALVGVILLIAISGASTFVYRVPGGGLTLTGVGVMIAMFGFSQLMTSGMGMQYGPAGSVVQAAVYTYGGFLCVCSAMHGWHGMCTAVVAGQIRECPGDRSTEPLVRVAACGIRWKLVAFSEMVREKGFGLFLQSGSESA